MLTCLTSSTSASSAGTPPISCATRLPPPKNSNSPKATAAGRSTEASTAPPATPPATCEAMIAAPAPTELSPMYESAAGERSCSRKREDRRCGCGAFGLRSTGRVSLLMSAALTTDDEQAVNRRSVQTQIMVWRIKWGSRLLTAAVARWGEKHCG
eukprot:440291-Pleurochrysis_carterae.AAC.1